MRLVLDYCALNKKANGGRTQITPKSNQTTQQLSDMHINYNIIKYVDHAVQHAHIMHNTHIRLTKNTKKMNGYLFNIEN